MSIYEEIRCAVDRSKQDVLSGSDVNAAVLKNTEGFGKEAMQRVIEEVNVNKFLDVLKSGDDRSQEFPLADPKVIFKEAADASFSSTDMDTDICEETPGLGFYDSEKAASIPDVPITHQDPKDISTHSIEFLLSKKEIMQKKAELDRDQLSQLDEMLSYNIQKMAQAMDMNQEKANKLFTVADKIYGVGDTNASKSNLISALCKHAHVKHDIFPNDDSFVDDTSEDFAMFKQSMRILDTRPKLVAHMNENLRKEAAIKGMLEAPFKKK